MKLFLDMNLKEIRKLPIYKSVPVSYKKSSLHKSELCDILDDILEIVVYGKDYCPHCRNAKLLLEKSNINFLYLDIEEHPPPEHIINPDKNKAKYKYIPQIINNTGHEPCFLGGYDMLVKFINKRANQ